MVDIATTKISNQLGTKVSVESVDFSFFNKADINGLLVADKKKDTILYAGKLNLKITDWFFFKDKADIKYIGLENAIIKLNRSDSIWNYQYIVDFFASPTPSKKNKNGLDLQLKKLNLCNLFLYCLH